MIAGGGYRDPPPNPFTSFEAFPPCLKKLNDRSTADTRLCARFQTPFHAEPVQELARRFSVSRIALVIRWRGLVLATDPRRSLLPARFFRDFMASRQEFMILDALHRRASKNGDVALNGE